jgi:hypothetical protein
LVCRHKKTGGSKLINLKATGSICWLKFRN